MNENFQKLEDLDVWKMCRELRIELIKLSKRFPNEEKFRLKDQVIRAARSITNNIAEGYGRFNYQENIQFLRICRGSIYECVDHMYCCLDESIINREEFRKLYNFKPKLFRNLKWIYSIFEKQKKWNINLTN